MKILFVSLYYDPEIGAAASRITNMVIGLNKENNDIDVLTSLPNYPKGRIFKGYRHRLFKKENIGNSHIFRYWIYATVSKKAYLRALSILSFSIVLWLFAIRIHRILQYDRIIIQCPPLPVATSAILLFKCIYRRTTIVNISDLWPISAVELGAMHKDTLSYKIFAYMERFTYNKVDGILAQSNESLEYIAKFQKQKPKFLYRNLQRYDTCKSSKERNTQFRVVYAGLLGVAQDLLSIIRNIDFKQLNIEFHLYGGGNQTEAIRQYISQKDTNVFYHGYVSKDKMAKTLSLYDASIIPLAVHIHGAIPSKLFDIIPLGIPVLFCGGGEGAEIVRLYHIGLVSNPGDYQALKDNLIRISSLPKEQYRSLTTNCIKTSQKEFNFDRQIKRCNTFITNLDNERSYK